jgi:hypothetical protein
VVAGAAAVAAYAMPLKLNILVAIAAAVAIGLLIDHTTTRAVPRSFFLLPDRELPIPGWLQRGPARGTAGGAGGRGGARGLDDPGRS